MSIENNLKKLGFKKADILYNRGKTIILAQCFYQYKSAVVLDTYKIFDTPFIYKRYCQKQNEWMSHFNKVYRFLEDDYDSFELFWNTYDIDYNEKRTFNREALSIDPTLLESIFEQSFAEAYGNESFKYLAREYSMIIKDGRTAYVDYALFNKNGNWLAFEENGVTYHHPYIIKQDKYREILYKQNSIVDARGKVFRWDSESLRNIDKTADEIKAFVGDLRQYIIQSRLSVKRSFKLFRHQHNHIEKLEAKRKAGLKSSLVVLPTGAGKSLIAMEDIDTYYSTHKLMKVLIIVPSIDLRLQWLKAIKSYTYQDQIFVFTYAAIYRQYQSDPATKYDYILIDEAHHAMAPTLKKVLQHYQPQFLLGLTATDKRLDEQKLETIFGSYDVELDLKEAIAQGVLAQIRCFRLETNIDLSQVRFNSKDYYMSQLERAIKVPSRNRVIAEVLHKYFVEKLTDKQGLVFCVSVNHAKDMAKVLREYGIKAESVDGKDKLRERKIKLYMQGEIQFLCTCSLLTEGWDAPQTSIIVMARPTLSRVLYTQQLGRGTRNYPGKEALYVIDVVDNYGSYGGITNRPWSLHSLLEVNVYKPFGDMVTRQQGSYDELVVLDTLYEKEIKLAPLDIFTMEQQFKGYLSSEQLARELFVSTGTVINWVSKKQIAPDVTIPIGRSKLRLFKPERVEEIRELKGLPKHSEETIVNDFWAFIEQGSYTFSYKMYFVLALLDCVDSSGDADINEVLVKYQQYYLQRFEQKLRIDRDNCVYNDRSYVEDKKLLLRSMVNNPFEKFERKRFFYYAKDLAKISIHHRIWDDLTSNQGLEKLRAKMLEDLDTYYAKLR